MPIYSYLATFFDGKRGFYYVIFLRNMSLIQIVEHPKVWLLLPQALNYGCVPLDDSGDQIAADSASSVHVFGKLANTLFYIGDWKLPVLGLSVQDMKRCVALGGGWW